MGGEKASSELRRAAAGCLASYAAESAACAATLVGLGVLAKLLALEKQGGGDASAARSAVNCICVNHGPAKLWNTGVVPEGLLVREGFYAVGADATFGSLAEQRAEGPVEGVSETLLVAPSSDPGLQQCVESATEELASLGADPGPEAVATVLARVVAAWQGGAVPYEAYEHYDNAAELEDLRHAAGCRVVALGALRKGRARQRSLLFKVLADSVGLPCTYQMGKCLRGAHKQHAWNTFVSGGEVLIVDVLHAPGELYVEGTAAARRYQRIDEFAFSSLAASRHAFTTPASTPAPRAESRRVA